MHPRLFLLLVVMIVITIMFICIYLRLKVYHTLYSPLRRNVKKEENKQYEELFIDTKRHDVYYSNPHLVKNRIHCWHYNRHPGKPVIYYLHGNNTDLHSFRFMVDVCQLLQYNMFMIDYRGFGRSSLDYVTQKNIIEDAEAGYTFLQRRYQSDKIVIWGISLGSNPALNLACQHPVHALILLSPYSSIHHMFNDFSLPKSLIAEPLKVLTSELNKQTTNTRLVKKIKCKTILIHSVDDVVVPYRHSKMLYNKMNTHVEKKLIGIKGPHDGPVFAPSQFKELLKFIDSPIHDIESIEKILEKVHGITPNL